MHACFSPPCVLADVDDVAVWNADNESTQHRDGVAGFASHTRITHGRDRDTVSTDGAGIVATLSVHASVVQYVVYVLVWRTTDEWQLYTKIIDAACIYSIIKM